MVTKDRTVWILLIFILCGLVIGGLLGELSKNIEWLWWLGYGQEFGLTAPLVLDLSVIKLSFSFTVKISIASIIGMILAIFIYRKV